MSISDFTIGEPEKKKEESSPVGDFAIETPKASSATVAAGPTVATPALIVPPEIISTPVSSAKPNVASILDDVLGSIGDDIGQGARLKMMVFGEPGSFKSSFVATAPNNLIVDLEDGLISAKHSPHGVAENVRPYKWKGFDHWEKTIQVLGSDPEELNWVEVLTIDTFSEMHKRGLQEIMEREWRKRPSINRYVPETEHHTENNERMLRMVRALRDLNRDILISTHSRTVEPKNKPSKTYADFSESLSNKLMGMMDVVGYMEKRVVDGKVVAVMRFQGDGSIHCKQRIGLPDELINPTYADIKRVWEASKNK